MRRILAGIVTHRWLITACLAAGILVLSLIPDPPKLGVEVSYGDKVGHFAAYFVFGFMLLLSIAGTGGARPAGRPAARPARSVGAAAAAVGIAVCYGGLIELLQHYTGRQTELGDLLADLAGAVTGALVLSLILRRRDSRQPESYRAD